MKYKKQNKKYYLDLLKNSTNIIGTALIGPLWEIKSLITSFYGKVKDSLYNCPRGSINTKQCQV